MFKLHISILIVSFSIVSILSAQESQDSPRRSVWSSRVIDLASTLPVQDSGRIKPLDTVARFQLLKLNGRRTCYSLDGQRLTPVEWVLDCLFWPELAANYKVFLVQNNAVLDAVKIPRDGKKKRDRYSYFELLAGRNNLYALAEEYRKIDEKHRDVIQAQVVHLAQNLADFEWLTHYLDFARDTFDLASIAQVSEVLGESSLKSLSAILKDSKRLKDFFLTHQKKHIKFGDIRRELSIESSRQTFILGRPN